MTFPSSFADVRSFTNELTAFIAARKFGYRGGVIRVAMTRHNDTMRFFEGCLIFQREQIPCAPRVNYGDALFLEEWIEPVDKVIDFLSPFLCGQRSVAGQKVTTNFGRTNWHHQDVVDFALTGWREWRFMSGADFLNNNEHINLGQEPLTGHGLAPYLNTGHAIADKLYHYKKWGSISSPYQGQFLTILPETRARLLTGEWRPGNLRIEIETNIPLASLELQVLLDLPKRRDTRLISLHDTIVEETVPLDAESAHIFLIDTFGECLSRGQLPSVFSSFGPEKPAQETYQRILAEISNGENDHVEYKAFVKPKDAKEKDIIKAAIAFANTLGGRIYVGVENDGTLQGERALCAAFHETPEKARADLRSHVQSVIVENVKPVPPFKIDLVQVKQQPVLVISVEGGNRKPYSNKSHEVWIRKGANDMVPDPQTEFPQAAKADFQFQG